MPKLIGSETSGMTKHEFSTCRQQTTKGNVDLVGFIALFVFSASLIGYIFAMWELFLDLYDD